MLKYNLLFTSMSGKIIGGGQRSLLLILERLNKKKFKPLLLCPTKGDLIDKVKNLGIETVIIRMGGLKNLNFFSNLIDNFFCQLINPHLLTCAKVERFTFYTFDLSDFSKSIDCIGHVS